MSNLLDYLDFDDFFPRILSSLVLKKIHFEMSWDEGEEHKHS